MTVRIRAILVIILTNLVIILFSVLAAVGFVKTNVEKSIETDLSVVADIADHFISSEIDNLKLKATEMVRNITEISPAEWPGVLTRQRELYPGFMGTAVYSADGELLAVSGEMPAPAEIVNDPYISQAFAGERILSSTYPAGNGVVFYLAVPVTGMDNTVLVITIPGMYFSQRLSTFVIWETGHIFIDDVEGYVIANIREEWVQNRFNFIRMAETDSEYAGIAETVAKMIRGETGIGRFSVAGVPRICAYRPVSGSAAGWCMGVIAPLPESLVRNTDKGLLVVALVGIFLNIIAAIIASNFIKKPFEKIAALKEEAEANSMSKSNFLATMSHEMRTPLNAVIGLSELTLDGKIDGEERENIETVYTAGVTLLSIINDILDISKIESGKFDINCVEYDLPSLINDAVTLSVMRIGEKPITFKLTVDETLPSKLFGDDLRIKQISNNLLSNAFKYTRAGFVEWRITWEKDGDTIWLVSSVTDTGIGIRQEDTGKLFQNYAQLDTVSHRKIEGTGLGLALTKRMVELMDGSISVESEFGKGSVFTFRVKQGFVTGVPIGPAVAESLRNFSFINKKQDRHTALVRIHLPNARVLVVDDISPNLAVVRGIMKPYGMRVDCVTSGEEAVRLIREGVRYNAIFMDHMMPGMNGIEAARIIRNDIGTEYARTVPVIALTANAIRGNEEMFLNSGFQAFLSKPIDIMQMDSVIRQWVRGNDHGENRLVRQLTGLPNKSNMPAKDNAAAPRNETANKIDNDQGIDGIDLNQALDLFAGDMESLVEVLRMYTEQVPPLLERIREFTPEKISGYIIDVHGLKGISRNIFAEKTGGMAEALERAGKAGDVTFITENNEVLIAAVGQLIAAIELWLASNG